MTRLTLIERMIWGKRAPEFSVPPVIADDDPLRRPPPAPENAPQEERHE